MHSRISAAFPILLLLVACKPAAPITIPTSNPAASSAPTAVDTTRKLKYGNDQRNYILHVPANLTTPAPLVLVFHGSGGTAEGTVKLTHFNDVADAHGFLVAYPTGIDKHWNIGADAKSEADDLTFVDDVLKDISSIQPVDSRRTYATGMSNGGFFSVRLACERSSTFAAVGIVAAGVLEQASQSCKPDHALPAAFFNGDADPLVPYQGGKIRATRFRGEDNILSSPQAAKYWADLNGVSDAPATTELPVKDADDSTRVSKTTFGAAVESWTVHGGGHTWPGGYQYLGERLVGKTTRQIDASEEIWKFFAAHPAPLR